MPGIVHENSNDCLAERSAKHFKEFGGIFENKNSLFCIPENMWRKLLQCEDFVIVIFPSRLGFWKFGIISYKISDHRYSVKILGRRAKFG